MGCSDAKLYTGNPINALQSKSDSAAFFNATGIKYRSYVFVVVDVQQLAKVLRAYYFLTFCTDKLFQDDSTKMT